MLIKFAKLNKLRVIFLGLLGFFIFAGVIKLNSQHDRKLLLKVGLPGQWKTLHPGLQHTLFGDLVLSNQFEALVGLNDNGVSVPLGAKSWEISSDFTVYRFNIDTSRRFSDGSSLTAGDYKSSWELAAQLTPISANSSLADVLYKIQGYEDFEKNGELRGVRVLDDETLEVRFSSPFRMALEHLQGNRFSAFKEKDGKFIGTGFYIIEEIGPEHLVLHPRGDLGISDLPTLDIRAVPGESVVQGFLNNEFDVIHYVSGHLPQLKSLKRESAGILAGTDALHMVYGLNTSDSSLFANRRYRIALNYLIHEILKERQDLLPDPAFFSFDEQFLLPLQAGRLDSAEVESLLAEGKVYKDEFLAATKERPLRVMTAGPTAGLYDLLKLTGVSLEGRLEYQLSTVYGKDGPDIVVRVFSVENGDPDGIYHVMGENGAIRTPYIYSPKVAALLEEGRKVVGAESLDSHYREVSKALISDAPMVHLGFAKAMMAYNKNTVEIDRKVLRRNQGQMHFLRVKE